MTPCLLGLIMLVEHVLWLELLLLNIVARVDERGRQGETRVKTWSLAELCFNV